MGASITCKCGKVRLTFPSNRPRVSTECCCNHCFARVEYLEKLGGPLVDRSKPVLCSKWDNRIKVESGKEHLMVYKMTPTTQVWNIASSCCHTFLLGRHSEYDANCVTTVADFPTWHSVDKDHFPFQASSRWFSNQWDPKRLEALQPLVGIWVNESDGSIVGEEGWEPIFASHMESTQQPISDSAAGESFDDIVDQIGRESVIIVSHATESTQNARTS